MCPEVWMYTNTSQILWWTCYIDHNLIRTYPNNFTFIFFDFISVHPYFSFFPEGQVKNSLSILNTEFLRRSDRTQQQCIYRKATWSGPKWSAVSHTRKAYQVAFNIWWNKMKKAGRDLSFTWVHLASRIAHNTIQGRFSNGRETNKIYSSPVS